PFERMAFGQNVLLPLVNVEDVPKVTSVVELRKFQLAPEATSIEPLAAIVMSPVPVHVLPDGTTICSAETSALALHVKPLASVKVSVTLSAEAPVTAGELTTPVKVMLSHDATELRATDWPAELKLFASKMQSTVLSGRSPAVAPPDDSDQQS